MIELFLRFKDQNGEDRRVVVDKEKFPVDGVVGKTQFAKLSIVHNLSDFVISCAARKTIGRFAYVRILNRRLERRILLSGCRITWKFAVKITEPVELFNNFSGCNITFFS